MTTQELPNYDYAEGKRRIAGLLAFWSAHPRDVKEDSKALKSFIKSLEQIEQELLQPNWRRLLFFHDQLSRTNGEDNSRSTNLLSEIRALKDTASGQLAALPDPRAKSEVPHAALLLIHLWHDCGRPRPTLYEISEFVIDLSEICNEAGITLSNERLTNIASEALLKFDHFFPPPELEDVLVLKN